MDLDDLYRLLRGAHAQAQGVMDTVRDPLLVLDSNLTVIGANPAFYRVFDTDRDATIDVPFAELGQGQWKIDALSILLEQVLPRSASVIDYEVTGTFPAIGHRTMLVSAQRLDHPTLGRRVLLLTIVDATEKKRLNDRNEILIGELHHRIKNLLAVTRSLARQTTVEGRSAKEYRSAFLRRFDALARSLDVSNERGTADLSTLLNAMMEPYRNQNATVTIKDGPQTELSIHQTMPVGMILHELTTNAVKHGALSVLGGDVTVDWWDAGAPETEPQISLRWKERGGPVAVKPDEAGFGTRMMQFAAEYDLGGNVELSYGTEGLTVILTFTKR